MNSKPTSRSFDEVRSSVRHAVAYLESLGRRPTKEEAKAFFRLETEIESQAFREASLHVTGDQVQALADEVEDFFALVHPGGESLTVVQKEKALTRAKRHLATTANSLRELRAAGMDTTQIARYLSGLQAAAVSG